MGFQPTKSWPKIWFFYKEDEGCSETKGVGFSILFWALRWGVLVVLDKTTRFKGTAHFVVSLLSLTSDSLTCSLKFLHRRRKIGRAGNRLAAVTAAAGFKTSTFLHQSLPLFFLITNSAFDFAENMRFSLDLKGDDRNPRGSDLHLLHDLVRSFLSSLVLRGYALWKWWWKN